MRLPSPTSTGHQLLSLPCRCVLTPRSGKDGVLQGPGGVGRNRAWRREVEQRGGPAGMAGGQVRSPAIKASSTLQRDVLADPG